MHFTYAIMYITYYHSYIKIINAICKSQFLRMLFVVNRSISFILKQTRRLSSFLFHIYLNANSISWECHFGVTFYIHARFCFLEYVFDFFFFVYGAYLQLQICTQFQDEKKVFFPVVELMKEKVISFRSNLICSADQI